MRRVTLTTRPPGPVTAVASSSSPASVGEALELAGRLGALRPFVGEGASLDVWEALATVAAHDLSLARAVEPHLDALTILRQAGLEAGEGTTWGVFAAEGAGVRLTATRHGSGWVLDGVKPWCSLAATLSDALVTAWVSDSERRLFRVSLDDAGVRVDTDSWVARGLAEIPSGPVRFASVPATPVGDTGWYLARPGFAWGGISVAACWFGGAVGLGRSLLEAARRRGDDEILLMHLGRVDAGLEEARSALASAATVVDSGDPARLVAKRARSTVARIGEDVLRSVGHALGPGPLATEPEHAKRVADLEIYLRQHHGERDVVSLGRAVRDSDVEW